MFLKHIIAIESNLYPVWQTTESVFCVCSFRARRVISISVGWQCSNSHQLFLIAGLHVPRARFCWPQYLSCLVKACIESLMSPRRQATSCVARNVGLQYVWPCFRRYSIVSSFHLRPCSPLSPRGTPTCRSQNRHRRALYRRHRRL
jgi:hypothetical protein